VQALARELPAVIPYMQDPRPFVDSIRGDILTHYAHRAKHGDWWGILDADEFYIDDPREFLESVPKRFNAVWMQLFVYLFTEKDAAAYRQDPTRYDDGIPIEQRMRYYVNGEYTGLRFFRHARNLARMPDESLRPVYPRRIRLKHFPYRSPEQIRLRLETRREPMERGEFLHEKRANWVPDGTLLPGPARPEDLPESWEERVASSSECHVDLGDGQLVDADAWAPPAGPSWRQRLRSRTRSRLRRALRVVGHVLPTRGRGRG
jgi:hypothetical protein